MVRSCHALNQEEIERAIEGTMDQNRKWTIAIRPADGQSPRKITKVIGLNGAGFSILAPYHKAREGYLFKLPVDPKTLSTPGRHQLPWDESVGFTADDRVKLSYHSDGFAQFSSETPGRITSGRDPKTGQPKGLGLFTHPLKTPIWSGPSVSVTIWGIDEFDELDETKQREQSLVFEPNEFYYRGCTPDEANLCWVLSIYVFPMRVTPPVRFHHGHPVLEVASEGLNGPLASVVHMRIIHLPEEEVFLGLYVNRAPTTLLKSGWALNGPGDFTAERKGHVLTGLYPRDEIPVEGRASLNRFVSQTDPGRK